MKTIRAQHMKNWVPINQEQTLIHIKYQLFLIVKGQVILKGHIRKRKTTDSKEYFGTACKYNP